MRNDLLKKGMVFGIIILFTGAGIIPPIMAVNEINNNIEQSEKSTTDWWPMFHHDLSHCGYSTANAPETNSVLWNYTAGNALFSSPAVVDGKIYIASFDFKLYCLNANTGEKIWDYTTDNVVFSSPAVANGKVYICSGDSKVYCLNAETGAKIWDYITNGFIYSSPAVANGKVYIATQNTQLYCLNAETGTLIWNCSLWPENFFSSPAIANGKVYIGTDAEKGKLHCLNAETGSKIWNYTTNDSVSSSPAIANGKVYVGSYDNEVYCLNAETGGKIWDYTTNGDIESSPAVANGKVYAGSVDDKFYCLNAETGAKIWDYAISTSSSPAIADGKIYFGSYNNKFYCLDADTGDNIWNYTTIGSIYSSPAIVDGKIYVGSTNNIVYCFGNQPPNPPIITGPHLGKINTEYMFTLGEITNPEGDQFYCLWDWGDGNTSGWLGPYTSGQTITAIHTWSEPSTYNVRLKVKDAYGAESDWSEPFTIYITSKILLIGFVQSAMNLGEECIVLNMSIALIIKLKPIDLKMYSSVQVLILNNELQGIIGSRFIAVLVYGLVLSEESFPIYYDPK